MLLRPEGQGLLRFPSEVFVPDGNPFTAESAEAADKGPGYLR